MFESRGVTIGVCVTRSKLSLKDLRSKTEDYCQYQYQWITPADTSRGRAAVIWKTLTMMAQAKHGRLRPSLLTHRFNMRGKIAMPVPGNSRWNFARVLVSHFTPDDESKVQLNDFVDRVHNGIKKMVADCAKVQAYLG
ncbi:hypothetical protein NC651_029217 [Populus alba x Populus x berolinensis]|nr:hypothetical protein NC651_029205 [Populus alba x Populus x berolinensis]KAJ6882876.1 hypothetical protein NC651_029217 [Populus alba x Populus x berolinensis]